MIEGYRNKKSYGRIYVLRKNGKIVFVGTVTEIANHYNLEPRNIYDMISKGMDILGMDIAEAIGGESITRAETRRLEPKTYRDSSSRRFTKL